MQTPAKTLFSQQRFATSNNSTSPVYFLAGALRITARITQIGVFLALLFCATSAQAIQKPAAKVTPLTNPSITAIHIAPDGSQTVGPPTDLATAFGCASRHDSGAVWAIDSWILGNELYKSYQDPPAACGGVYPYTVQDVHFVLQIAAAANITIALDLESVDLDFLPGCPVPGSIVYLGALTDVSFPSGGLFDVTITLDTPQVVAGPFFVGFFFATTVDPLWHLSLVTDDIQVPCVSFNIWDTTIGYVDLGDDLAVRQSVYPPTDPCFNDASQSSTCFGFDGRIVLYTSGLISESAGCCQVAGDANHDGSMNIADITFMIHRIFSNGPSPVCADEFDANGDNSINIGDVTLLLARVFQNLAAPICGTTGI